MRVLAERVVRTSSGAVAAYEPDQPMPDALADVARALGEALAAQFQADHDQICGENGADAVRNSVLRAGFSRPPRTGLPG
jgi:hypothetical protein